MFIQEKQVTAPWLLSLPGSEVAGWAAGQTPWTGGFAAWREHRARKNPAPMTS